MCKAESRPDPWPNNQSFLVFIIQRERNFSFFPPFFGNGEMGINHRNYYPIRLSALTQRGGGSKMPNSSNQTPFCISIPHIKAWIFKITKRCWGKAKNEPNANEDHFANGTCSSPVTWGTVSSFCLNAFSVRRDQKESRDTGPRLLNSGWRYQGNVGGFDRVIHTETKSVDKLGSEMGDLVSQKASDSSRNERQWAKRPERERKRLSVSSFKKKQRTNKWDGNREKVTCQSF